MSSISQQLCSTAGERSKRSKRRTSDALKRVKSTEERTWYLRVAARFEQNARPSTGTAADYATFEHRRAQRMMVERSRFVAVSVLVAALVCCAGASGMDGHAALCVLLGSLAVGLRDQ